MEDGSTPDFATAIEFLEAFELAKPARPKSATYMRRWKEREPFASSPPASTAYREEWPLAPIPSPRQPRASSRRPSSAHQTAGLRRPSCTKTERWRELGVVRWPPVVDGQEHQRPVADNNSFTRYWPEMQQPEWHGEVWTRSLRKPGVLLQHPAFAAHVTGLSQLHKDWRSYGMPLTAREWPYCGSTPSGRMAINRPHNDRHWVERPVATGKYALNHMDGARYLFDQTPRNCLRTEPGQPRARTARRGRPAQREW
mmetsp:Transcript_47226/g.85139  ORF Transcript_47226/g.85139 Transcript_47226/m.85139 type:complete len:255 (+) Transcript_47226:76-840(+)